MSHVVEILTEVRDPIAIRASCQRLALPPPVYGETQLFSESKIGWAVELPEWRYPIVCDVSTGRIDFDNFNNRWGKQSELDSFLQRYAVEKAVLEARRRGHSVTEQNLADGSIKLTVSVGGAA
jgi:hypothetical protein